MRSNLPPVVAALICEGPMEARLERVSEIREKACV